MFAKMKIDYQDFFDQKLKKKKEGEEGSEDDDGQKPRHCGDLCFLCLFIAMWIALITIAVVTGIKGDPARLTRGADMWGNLCGEKLRYTNISQDVAQVWEVYDYVWYPIRDPSTYNENNTIATSLKLGVCVMLNNGNCPQPGETVSVYGNITDVNEFSVTYWSKPQLGRCLPVVRGDAPPGGAPVPQETLDLVKELQEMIDISSFWFEGVAEVKNCHKVIVVAGFLGVTYALLWCFALRTSIRITTYGTLFVFSVFLFFAGFIAWYYANKLQDDEEGDADKLEVRTSHWWRVFSIVMWIGILVMGGVAYYLHNRMSKLVAIIKQGLRVQSHIMGLALVPVWGFLLIAGLTVFMCYVAANIETSDELTDQRVLDGDADVFETTVLREWTLRAYFHVLNILMWVWSIGFANALCYCVISFCTVFWYFSSRGDLKEAPEGIGSRGLHTACKYHLGTIAFGSLTMFIGSIFKLLFWVLRFPCSWMSGQERRGCCDWCICKCFVNAYDNNLRYLTQYSYVMTAMMGTGLCNSGRQAHALVSDEVELAGGKLMKSVVAVNAVSDTVILVGKLLITTINVVFSWLMIEHDWEELVGKVRNPTLPLILIGVATYLIATLFIDLTAAVVDNLIICYCYDRSINSESGDYFMPSGIRAAMLGDAVGEQQGLLDPDPRNPGDLPLKGEPPGARSSVAEVADALSGEAQFGGQLGWGGGSESALDKKPPVVGTVLGEKPAGAAGAAPAIDP